MSRQTFQSHPFRFLDWSTLLAALALSLANTCAAGTHPIANSTNCLLNSYAINVHLEQSGFHPYVAELAGLVREGRMSREEALERINTPPNEKVVNFVTDRLGVARITGTASGESRTED